MIQTYIDATYADIDAAKLGPTVAACEKYAALDEKGASDLGLITGTPVFGGMIDVTAASAGCGCCKEGDAHIYLGSSGWMSALISQACDGSEGSYLLDSIDPKLLIYGGCTNSCCLMFDWVIDKFYHKEKEELGSGIYELIDEEVAKVPAGCEGLHPGCSASSSRSQIHMSVPCFLISAKSILELILSVQYWKAFASA